MYCRAIRTDAEKRGRQIKVDAPYPRTAAPSAELPQLLGVRHAKDAYDGALVGGSSEHCACRVEREARDGCLVRLNDVEGRERDGIE